MEGAHVEREIHNAIGVKVEQFIDIVGELDAARNLANVLASISADFAIAVAAYADNLKVL